MAPLPEGRLPKRNPPLLTQGRHSANSEAAISICLCGEAIPRAYLNEVHVKTLVSSAIFAKGVASKVLKIYSPALFARRVCGKLMPRGGRAVANPSDILPDFGGQTVDMLGIPRIIMQYGAAFRRRREFTRKQKRSGQQEGAEYHLKLPRQHDPA
jgi:hypothetical protein